MAQDATGLAPNCKLIEGGGGFDDHVECSKRNATSKLLGSLFSVRIASWNALRVWECMRRLSTTTSLKGFPPLSCENEPSRAVTT
jgi:hypothetical protein